MPNKGFRDATAQHVVDKHGHHMSKVGAIHNPNVPSLKEAPVRPHPVKGGETRGAGKK